MTTQRFRKRAVFISVLIATLLVMLSASFAFAEKEVKSEKETKKKGQWSRIRCESLRGSELAGLKAAMVDHCDLDKPFSFTQLGTGLDSGSYTYCCHKKEKDAE